MKTTVKINLELINKLTYFPQQDWTSDWSLRNANPSRNQFKKDKQTHIFPLTSLDKFRHDEHANLTHLDRDEQKVVWKRNVVHKPYGAMTYNNKEHKRNINNNQKK